MAVRAVGGDRIPGRLEPSKGIDNLRFRRLNQRRDYAQGGDTVGVTREQRDSSIQGNVADQILDIVTAYLDSTFGEMELETTPAMGDVADFLVGPGLGRDAGAPLLQPAYVCAVFDRGPRIFFDRSQHPDQPSGSVQQFGFVGYRYSRSGLASGLVSWTSRSAPSELGYPHRRASPPVLTPGRVVWISAIVYVPGNAEARCAIRNGTASISLRTEKPWNRKR